MLHISLITTPPTILTAQSTAKQIEAPTSNDKLLGPHLALVLPQAASIRSSVLPCIETTKQAKQVITLDNPAQPLATMPGRLPTTKDFPSTVKLSIVPRKYVSHRATPSSINLESRESLPSLRVLVGGERLSTLRYSGSQTLRSGRQPYEPTGRPSLALPARRPHDYNNCYQSSHTDHEPSSSAQE